MKKNTFHKDFEEFAKDTSSKLENVKIKLFDYSYFHSPRKILPQRWVERRQLKEKLQSLINQSNTKCGAYLVTGYRGVGKSSIVQELVDESSMPKGLGLHAKSIILRILFFTPILQILYTIFESPWKKLYAPLGPPLFISMVAYLCLMGCLWSDGFLSPHQRKGIKFGDRIKNLYYFINNKISRRRYLQSLSDTGFIFLCISLSFLLAGFFNPDSKIGPVTYSIIISFAYWLVLRVIQLAIHKSFIQKRKTNKRKVFININFGHDELKEIDIFRLISFSLRDKLTKKYRSANVRLFEFTYKLAIALIILFLINNIPANHSPKNTKASSEAASAHTHYETVEPLNDATPTFLNTEKNSFSKESLSFFNRFIQISKHRIDTLYNDIRERCHLGPATFPYKDCFIIFILYLMIHFITYLFNGGKNYKKVLRKMNELIEHIEASITSEGQKGFSSKGIFYQSGKRKHFPMADTREIERRLIDLLDLMRELPFLFHRFEIIFIFDELDKLEPRSSIDSEKSIYSAKTTGHNPEEIRQRQDNIFKVLSNMKYFLSTAKAKFIFLAGRDMYDAALADVADRNSFLSSIFYDVIYVPSIYSASKNHNESHETTEFIETFICKQIMPNHYLEDIPNTLQKYNHFLKTTFDELNEDTKTERKAIVAKQKREKIIFTLYHFIVYLTHLSNGSIKKMISLFEDYLKFSFQKENILFTQKYIRKGELYLNFSPDDQHLFAMVNYLTNPMILKQNFRGSNLYGDKLLVQTSYIVDHILKFHKQAFTNGNLESIPEILDPNRSPELRRFLKETLLGFSKTHLEKVNFNLPNYKFNRLIRLEISFLSKISEQASAAFNFSLDESLSMKRHFENLLEDHSGREIQSGTDNSNAAICSILGDLYYYDEQFDEAIRYYSKALEQLKQKDKGSTSNLTFYLRVSLKLSLVFEKRKAFDAAFSIYNHAINIMEDNQHIPQQVEFCKLMYQPILAKLYLIEKTSPGGLILHDMDDANDKFERLIANFNHPEKTAPFRSDFYYKTAILLYWKNPEKTPQGVLFYIVKCINTIFENDVDWEHEMMPPIVQISRYDVEYVFGFIKSIHKKIKIKLDAKDLLLREEGIKQLAKCLSFFGDFALSQMSMEDITNEERIENIKDLYESAGKISKYNNDDKNYIWNITKILYLFKFAIKNLAQNPTNIEWKTKLIQRAGKHVQKIIQAAYSMEDNVYKHEIEKLKLIFTDIKTASGQIGKSFQNLKNKYPQNKPRISFKRATISVELEETLTLYEDLTICAQPTIDNLEKIFSKHTNTAYRLGNNSLNQILWLKNSFHLNYEIFNHFFKFPSIEEINYTKTIDKFNHLFSESSDMTFDDLLKKFITAEEKGDDENIFTQNPSIKNRIFEYFLFNSIYCGLEIIRLYKSHGDNKLLSHMFLAKTYEYMIFWTSIWNFYQHYFQLRNKPDGKYPEDHMINYDYLLKESQINKDSPDTTISDQGNKDDTKKEQLEKMLNKALEKLNAHKEKDKEINKPYACSSIYLEKLIGKQNINILSHVYYAEEARKYYHYTKDAYSERTEYKKEIQEYFYLNDDFNDNRSLFFIAYDRVEIQEIDEKIKTLKALFYNSQYYNPDLYYKTVVPDKIPSN